MRLNNCVFAVACVALAVSRSFVAQTAADDVKPRYRDEKLQGRVVWLAEAQKRLFGIDSVPEAAERSLALETTDGKLIPLVEDVRGRGFRVDKRLREMDVELLVRRYEGSPAAQILAVYRRQNDDRIEVDYWCDICAIAMYELKPCECCQGESRLRERKVGQAKRQ
jgi:hypothetical protein